MEVPKGESVYLVINGESPVKSSAVGTKESTANLDHAEPSETSSVESSKTESSKTAHESFLKKLLDRLFGRSDSTEVTASRATAPTSTTASTPENSTVTPTPTTSTSASTPKNSEAETPSTTISKGKKVTVIEWPGLRGLTKEAN